MDQLHTYVPILGNGKPYTIPTHGDGLSVERMRDAKATRAPSLTAVHRLEGLGPVPQEWHKRNLVMQVYAAISLFLGNHTINQS